MKKQNKIIIALFIALISGGFSSCNFLNVDDYFLDTLKEDSIFHTRRNAEGYLWNTATLFPSADRIWGASYAPGELASDELTARWKTGQFPGIQFTVGEINAYNVESTTMYIWNTMYKVINRCNEMLDKINDVPGMTTTQKAEYIAYVHFMRGYAYYFLLQNWGPLLIVGDDIIDSSKGAEYFNRYRSTYDESVDYVVNEFELAAKSMPTQERMPLAVYGRPSKGAALSLIARLRLQQASPLFNGGSVSKQFYGNWVDADRKGKDGKPFHYVNVDGNKDDMNKRWAVAAHAAKRVIDMAYYELYTVPKYEQTPALPANVDPNGVVSSVATAGSIDPYHSYKDMFSGEALPKFNKEIIWGIEHASSVRTYIEHSFPRNLGGWGGMSVPQKVVDKFLMRDGRTIDNSSAEYPYNADPKKKISKPQFFSGYKLIPGQVPAMYGNREMRFYANIGFSGRYWTMSSATAEKFHDQKVFYMANESSGKKGAGSNKDDYTSTGYVPVKYIHNDDALKDDDGNNSVTRKSFPIIRYAEILLSYAEALNELEGSVQIKDKDVYGNEVTKTYSRDANEILTHFNMIRYRVGLPGVKTLPTQAEMREIIKRERDIEFFNENQRFYDVRRWGDYLKDDLGSTFMGFNVEGKKSKYYEIVNVNTQVIRDRVTDKKMIWLPLSHYELLKVPKMDQNPGYNK